jgi:hypothetical protein
MDSGCGDVQKGNDKESGGGDEMKIAKKETQRRDPPCIYKKSCGLDEVILLGLCGKGSCPDYKPKKRGEPYYGEEDNK